MRGQARSELLARDADILVAREQPRRGRTISELVILVRTLFGKGRLFVFLVLRAAEQEYPIPYQHSDSASSSPFSVDGAEALELMSMAEVLRTLLAALMIIADGRFTGCNSDPLRPELRAEMPRAAAPCGEQAGVRAAGSRLALAREKLLGTLLWLGGPYPPDSLVVPSAATIRLIFRHAHL